MTEYACWAGREQFSNQQSLNLTLRLIQLLHLPEAQLFCADSSVQTVGTVCAMSGSIVPSLSQNPGSYESR